ncbi:MAG: type II toxin-antitoxin system VapC family toxin [Candidatus Sulfotelmatobacter sp.]
MKAIADTGFIVAFKNRSDQHHGWAVAVARDLDAPALTCESVLSEAAFHLGSTEQTLALVAAGMLRVSFDCNQHIEKLRELALRYADRNPDLADLCLIRMSELNPHHAILTIDQEDFRIYRRNKREAIPLLCPPK